MKNLKLTAGQSVRVRTPQGDIVVEVAPSRKVVRNLVEVAEPEQTLYYIVGWTSFGTKATPIMDVEKTLELTVAEEGIPS